MLRNDIEVASHQKKNCVAAALPVKLAQAFVLKRAAERQVRTVMHVTSNVTRHILQVQQQKSEHTEHFAQEQGMGARASLPFPLRTSHATPCTSFVT